jgi:2-hydroxychromene-2-carboxylate isomerase
MKIEWYFDFVSPFSYLQWAHQLPRVKNIEVDPRPLLFAGLLKHWGHKGPAEIDGKRRFTYRHVVWLAERLGVPFRMPAAHPFNPLPLLRASIACDNAPEVIDRLFGFVWRDGHIPAEESPWRQLLRDLDVAETSLKEPEVKRRLMANGEQAIAAGVFGVPTFVVGGELFWGFDGFDFLLEYLSDPAVIATPEMLRADAVPSGV